MRQRRFLSWVIVFALLVGMLAIPAYAEGNTTTISGDGTADKTGTMTITLVIPKKTPAATDLTYTAPSDLTYSGSDKAATVAAASGVTGLGEITVKYYSDASRTTEVTEIRNVGTYYVGATVAEGDQYAASTAVLYGDGWTFDITPSTPSAPNAPTMASATKNSITLNAVDNCEYSKDGASWQDSTEFTGLLPGMEYTFYQRIKATTNTNPSAASQGATFTTEADTYGLTITLVIKPTQTITAEDVTATYGDTDKSVSASVTDPATGGGAISYAVKEGSEDYIDVAADGKLTIKAVPPTDGKAYVIVTAAETDDYAETTKEVTVTISNAPPVITLSDDFHDYDGSPKQLISSVAYSGTENLYLKVDCLTSYTNTINWTKYTGPSNLTNVFAPTNAGTYRVSYFLGTPENSAVVGTEVGQTSIYKVLPRPNNFTFTAPNSLNYDGTKKTATVTTKDGVNGMGEVTVKYYSDEDRYNEVNECINVGTYYVGIEVDNGYNYDSDDHLYDDSWKFTITPSTPSAPNAPTMASATKNSITLNAVDNCEYSKDGASWQDSTEFTGLLPGTEYTFYQRIKATTNTNPSAASQGATFTTEADTYGMTITLVIKPTQTITAEYVTATYGDTDKSVSASVTDPTEGGGAITYAVKDGSGDYISVASDGKLTIKKVPPTDGKAYVIVKAAGTDTHAETTKEVTVTISKATVTITAKDQSIMVGGTVPTLEGADFYTVTGLVGQDTLTTTPTLAYQKNGSATTPDNTTAGTYDIVASGASAGDNYTITYANGTLAISGKGNQTITADNVTVTYGDTGKSVSASVTTPATGGGAISYTVKSGSEDYIDVNASTGALTIKKVGTATVVVTAAETSTYAQATKEVTVTINKANAVAATVTANSRTYDGTEKPLVTVTGEATGGEMQYALGTATEATEPYTTSIPSKTDAGTYYVWYKVVGDANHNDSEAACVTVTIAKIIPVEGVDFTVEALHLTYTGVQKELVRQTILTDGLEIEYSFDNGASIETGLPMKKASGEYKIYYRVIGNDIYETLDWTGPVTATITMYATFSNPDFVLPAFLTEIGEEAFAEDTSLTIMDASNCAKIDANAFRDCTNLKRIRLSQNCEIDDTAFAGCVALRAVFAPAGGTTAAWCASHDVNFVPISQN